jgi:hypothetical protein
MSEPGVTAGDMTEVTIGVNGTPRQAPRVIALPVKEEMPCRGPAGAVWREPANYQER